MRFEEQLFLYLPEAMRASDTQELRALVEVVTAWGELVNQGENGTVLRGELERMMRMFGLWFDRYRYILDSLTTFWDADNVDIDFLPYLAEYLGWELDRNLSPSEQRKIVRQAVALYKIKGTRQAYSSLFTAVGFDVDLQEFPPSHLFRVNAVSRDNLNTLNIPKIDKLLHQIEWMRPINALILGLSFTKWLPEYFDEYEQTWKGDSEFVSVTDSFYKILIKRVEDQMAFRDSLLGTRITAVFQDSGFSTGQALKYDGSVKYGDKFHYYTTNRLYYSEDLTKWSKTASITTPTQAVSIPPGANTAWNISKSAAANQYVSILYSGFGSTNTGQHWIFSCWLGSGTSAQAEVQIVSSGLPNGLGGYGASSGVFALGGFASGGRSTLETATFTSNNHNIEVRIYPQSSFDATAQSIAVSSPQLELVESGVKPIPSLYIQTLSGVVETRTRHYPSIYYYDYPVLQGGFPDEGTILWLIRAVDGTIISRTEAF